MNSSSYCYALLHSRVPVL